MEPLWIVLIALAVLVIALVVVAWVSYSRLSSRTERVDATWAGVSSQLKARADILPELIDRVRNADVQGAQALEDLTKARARSISAASPGEVGLAEQDVQSALQEVFAVAKNGQVSSQPAFLDLQGKVVSAEDAIQAARRTYNGEVRSLNAAVHSFPTSIFAGMMGFKDRELFEDSERAAVAQPPKVEF